MCCTKPLRFEGAPRLTCVSVLPKLSRFVPIIRARTTGPEGASPGGQQSLGRPFRRETDRRVEAFTESICFDRRLFEHDIRGSIAHAEMLAQVGLLTADEASRLCGVCRRSRRRSRRARFAFVLELEDIHMHIEAALIERLGDVGRKLHTGRSRNDQVATDVKLWVRDALDRIDARLLALAARLRRRRRAAPRRDPARLHAPAAGPAGAGRALLPGLRREVAARPRPRWPTAASASTSCRWARPPWPARRCRSTASTSRRELGFDGVAANSLDVVQRPRFRARVRLRPVADRRAPRAAGPRSGSSGARRSSASWSCPTPSAPAAASCRTRRTPTCWS